MSSSKPGVCPAHQHVVAPYLTGLSLFWILAEVEPATQVLCLVESSEIVLFNA